MAIGTPGTNERAAHRGSARSALRSHYETVSKLHLRQLFADDPERAQRMLVQAEGICLDYSKNRVTRETLRLLVQLADEAGLRTRINAMLAGEKINITEDRAAAHVALRAPKGASFLVDGKNVVPDVHAVLDRMSKFSAKFGAEPGRVIPASAFATS